MKAIESVLASIGLLLLRLGFGGVMLFAHGWGKLIGFSERSATFPDPIGWGSQMSLISAIGTEVVCSVLLILGLFTRIAAIPLAFTMMMAAFVIHAKDGFDVKEKAILFLIAYVALIFTGGGNFALDRFLWRKKGKKK